MPDNRHTSPVPTAPPPEPDAVVQGPVRELEPDLDEPDHIHAVPLDFLPEVDPVFHVEPLSGPTEASEETPPPVALEE